MTLNNMTNLYAVQHKSERLTVAVVAQAEDEAREIAIGYFKDRNFSISKPSDIIVIVPEIDRNYDCDYILTANDEYF